MLKPASCAINVPDLSEFHGINFIENHRFSSNLILGPNLNKWVFACTNDTEAPNASGHYYMGFNSNMDGTSYTPADLDDLLAFGIAPGLPQTTLERGDIARLEIFNLVEDGKFHSGIAGWEARTSTGAIGGANISHVLAPVFPSAARGLRYEFTSASPYRVNFNLNTVRDTFLLGQEYIIRLNFYRQVPNSLTHFQFREELPRWDTTSAQDWNAGYTRFPDENAPSSRAVARGFDDFFSIIYSHLNIEGYIDNFRVVRSSNINYYLKLTIPYSAPGRPNLTSGRYRFTVYFKKDPTADDLTIDRFHSSRVSLGIGRTQSTATIRSFDASQLSATAWTPLHVEQFFQIRSGDSLVLLISPTDVTGGVNTLDIGSVLIAFPELRYMSR
ncbi:MAG: hypothetical protein FWC36_03735 [Spirochaetes bacterium]|nr:hypothetical protein [Spirochaetota bacterium]